MLALHKRRINSLADFIEVSVTDAHFYMGMWFENHQRGGHIFIGDNNKEATFSVEDAKRDGRYFKTAKAAAEDCGTAACIAGWCALQHPRAVSSSHHEIMESARDYLGLTGHDANYLFTPEGLSYLPLAETKWEGMLSTQRAASRHYSKKNAVKVLRELAATGEVPKWWSDFQPDDDD